MVYRKVFYEEYSVYDGMPIDEVQEQKGNATERMLGKLNEWHKPEFKIISIQEDSYYSHNSDNTPFWVRVIVYYYT